MVQYYNIFLRDPKNIALLIQYYIILAEKVEEEGVCIKNVVLLYHCTFLAVIGLFA